MKSPIEIQTADTRIPRFNYHYAIEDTPRSDFKILIKYKILLTNLKGNIKLPEGELLLTRPWELDD